MKMDHSSLPLRSVQINTRSMQEYLEEYAYSWESWWALSWPFPSKCWWTLLNDEEYDK